MRQDSDFEIIIFSAMLFQDLPHLVAEVTFDFEHKASGALLRGNARISVETSGSRATHSTMPFSV